ncbi:MAG TPA: aminotransferase class III-fold pyridoxal phosphate-dependent enzyme, partial [Kofleriaceae bacterium]|nr:aminotransferase class III-fold pyridoxal phosphate-dependent enzyme [Kofleriaceae bacterium]
SWPAPTHAAAALAPVNSSGARPAVAADAGDQPYVPYTPVRKGALQPSTWTPSQEAHLAALLARYTARTGTSKALAQRYRPVLADNRASAGFRLSIKEMLYPIVSEHSQGARIWDIDGNEYVDLTMGFGVNLFGHRPAFINAALERQLASGYPLGPQTHLAGEVAALICELTGMERVSFANSGTEAVLTAIRIARTATRRSKIAIFAGSYHGFYDATLATTERRGDELFSSPMAPGIPQGMVQDVVVLKYDSAESLEELARLMPQLAAVLVEPVQSRHVEVQPRAFLQRLRELTAAAGTLLIFDEMITGFRIHAGGAQAHFGVRADLATYGKILGGGMPIGAVAGKAELLATLDGGMWQYGDASFPGAETTFIAGTFCKHPLSLAAAKAVLLELQRRGPSLHQELNQRTAAFVAELNAWFEDAGVPV